MNADDLKKVSNWTAQISQFSIAMQEETKGNEPWYKLACNLFEVSNLMCAQYAKDSQARMDQTHAVS